MKETIECPLCGRQTTDLPRKSWKFNAFTVRRYQCDLCKSKFNIYKSPKSTFFVKH